MAKMRAIQVLTQAGLLKSSSVTFPSRGQAGANQSSGLRSLP